MKTHNTIIKREGEYKLLHVQELDDDDNVIDSYYTVEAFQKRYGRLFSTRQEAEQFYHAFVPRSPMR